MSGLMHLASKGKVTGVPVLSFTSVGDDNNGLCFLLLLVLPATAAADADSLALAWRMNIASMPSLRFCTGSMNVSKATPTFPTSLGTV